MVLIFVRMKHAADRLARQLEQHGIATATLHSNRSQNQRLRALSDFKSGAVRVLVATDIAARGIDVDGISHVVNFDFPMHAEDYVHRIGRTGRAGARGASWTFVTPLQRSDVRSYERKLGIQVQYRELPALPRPIGLVPDVQAFLAAMSAAQPPSNEPKPTPTKTFSSSRRRRR